MNPGHLLLVNVFEVKDDYNEIVLVRSMELDGRVFFLPILFSIVASGMYVKMCW